MKNLITPEEYSFMDRYRQDYASNNEAYCNWDNQIPIRNILTPWEKAKSNYLFKLFGDKLILSKEFIFEKPFSELEDEMADMLYGNQFGRLERSGKRFYDDYTSAITEKYFAKPIFFDLRRLVDSDTLVSNKVPFTEPLPIELPNGKIYKIMPNAKTMKVLAKLAAAWNLSGFEDFRICHSQILNQRSISGEVTLSIHPLDYMTMSDNESGWDSCMSWREEGSYRQGTVEMMNSECVIVAYLAAKECNGFWNNKKWRELFIVTKDMISEVKAYPYENKDLSGTILNWLKELAAANLNWHYDDAFTASSKSIEVNGHPHKIVINSYSMYDDLGSRQFQASFATNLPSDKEIIEIYYSGPNECMICGRTESTFADDSCLACTDCQTTSYCDCCGDAISPEDIYTVDGYTLCNWCYSDKTVICPVCDEDRHEDCVITLAVVADATPEELEANRQTYIERNTRYGVTRFDDDAEYVQIIENFCICPECKTEFVNKYLKPNRKLHERNMGYYNVDCMFFNDLNELGIELLGCGDTNEEFKKDLGQAYIRSTRT